MGLTPFRVSVLNKYREYQDGDPKGTYGSIRSTWIASDLKAREDHVSKALDWLEDHGYLEK